MTERAMQKKKRMVATGEGIVDSDWSTSKSSM